ncbi:SDR family oxidoreductase [Mycolicibacterium sp. CBMA 226]|uniref:SDR family oxidoreductase n=1 Tax=Mycolicibacterium sp. CBMA 226 TaxID=2606611 RepID=UPI00130C4600|nr:SDR family oxidoreductase [Mycolicibacterium sp. CBMA 226]MUL79067.1 SDR family oxidoreductase [Mycolicibacterium sp. CBMA 226]QGW61393.1 3-oxoacyl-[acyl-carrier-protein] reductase FabG [Mycolicibacterium sp.]
MSRTWFITGVSSGFGRELTQQLLQRGDRVAGTVRNPNAVDDLKVAYGERLWTVELDVTDREQIRSVVQAAFNDLTRIDAVINNAGYGLFGAAEEMTDEQVIHQIRTNLLGSIQVTRAMLPYLRAQGGGRIIQMSTWGGQATGPGGSLYHASKWGIEGFMEATAKDVAPFGIGVTIVEPGGARTDFRRGGVRLSEPMAAYDASPASMARNIPNLPPAVGDPAKMATIIIDSVDQDPAPLRIALGSDAYNFIHTGLTERLASLEAQRDLAFSTDFAPKPAAE